MKNTYLQDCMNSDEYMNSCECVNSWSEDLQERVWIVMTLWILSLYVWVMSLYESMNSHDFVNPSVEVFTQYLEDYVHSYEYMNNSSSQDLQDFTIHNHN